MSLAAKDIPQARPNFANYVLKNLQTHANSSNLKQEPCIYASHMLTRIAYQALGMQGELPLPIKQTKPAPMRPFKRLVKGLCQEEETSLEGEEELNIPKNFEISTFIFTLSVVIIPLICTLIS